jgi:D-3-phosphoglycerate dehydrogenase
MKPGACLINVARGGIVDEEALARKLINKEIAGAAFDVFSSEPPEAANKLLGLSNIILTPHSAALTRECVIRVAVEAATGVVDYLKGETPRFVFNEELLNKIKS